MLLTTYDDVVKRVPWYTKVVVIVIILKRVYQKLPLQLYICIPFQFSYYTDIANETFCGRRRVVLKCNSCSLLVIENLKYINNNIYYIQS